MNHIIKGILEGAAGMTKPGKDYLHQHRENLFQAQQLSQQLNHQQRMQLAENASKNAEFFGGVGTPVGRDMHMLSQELLSYPLDGNFEGNVAKAQARYSQLVSAGNKLLAQDHAGNTPPIQPVGASVTQAPTAQNSGVFGKFIGPGATEASPLPGALPNANPLTSPAPSAPGGAGSPGAAFRPAAQNAYGDSWADSPARTPVPVPSAPQASAGGPEPSALAAPVVSPIPPVSPSAGAPPNIQADVDEFNRTGYMSPVLRGMLPGQTALYQGQQKLPLVQKIMDEIGPISDENGIPDMRKFMRAEAELSALGISAPNMAPMLLQLASPRSEPGMQPFGNLSEKEKAFYAKTHPGQDISQIDPNTPTRIISHKFSGEPMEINLQSVPLSTKQFAEGPFNFNPRTGKYDPVPGLTPIAMVPHEGFMSVQQADGSISLVPVETGKKQIAAHKAIPTPNSVANAQPDVAAAIAEAQRGSIQPVAPTAPPALAPVAPVSGTNGRIGRGIKVGDRNLPPDEKIKHEQQAELYNTSIGNIESLKSELPILANMISAGKIAMQASPDAGWAHALVNRLMPLSPEEAAAAAHWQQMNDEIFELRIPLGAAAGRNAAMMSTIQANRGTLTQNPEVLAHMLENVGAEFRNLRKPLVEAGAKYGYNVEPELKHARDVIPTVTGLTATHKMNGRGIALDPKSNQWVFVDDGKPAK